MSPRRLSYVGDGMIQIYRSGRFCICSSDVGQFSNDTRRSPRTHVLVVVLALPSVSNSFGVPVLLGCVNAWNISSNNKCQPTSTYLFERIQMEHLNPSSKTIESILTIFIQLEC